MKYIIGNWKMNIDSEAQASALLAELEHGVENTHGKEVVICPSYLYLSIAKRAARKFKLGAQAVSKHVKGAHTGEIGIEQLKSFGVEYVLIGHSETRDAWKETESDLAAKLVVCVKNEIIPVLCVGSGLEPSDDMAKIKSVIRKQVNEVIHGIAIKKLIVAYEPVWAIGSGQIPDQQHIEEIGKFIKSLIDSEHVSDLSVLYGGSVTGSTANQFSSLDGLLVGGASLDSFEFAEIVKNA